MKLTFPVTAADYRKRARARLPKFLFDYLDGGATDEQTLRANETDWHKIKLRQRVLVDVDQIDTATTIVGESCAMPVVLAPLGLAGMMARRGEVLAARSAEAAGIPFTLSTVGICPVEEVQAAVNRATWFQLYMIRDRKRIKTLLDKAWTAGCRTLVFTVDLPQPGMRHRDVRNGISSPGARAKTLKMIHLLSRPRWLWDVAIRGGPLNFGNLSDVMPGTGNLDAIKAWIDAQFDPTVTWEDMAWLRQHWQGQLLLKGILDTDDARQAVKIGADGIVISNHGGRQLDGVASSVSKLPEIVAAVGSETEILVDGGVRSGVDIFRALALGAQGVMIGRPWAWALAGAGETGLNHLLASLQQELRLAMTLTGVTRINDIGTDQLERIGDK
ncbi:L-lactate dehydrogenase [Marinicella gelatinilytica]|uniref:L-lactate dehydrogenase n=1 Tax=Marinicella gelatinilytica TaxID=2996017 RepID=UPI0022609FFC|nr:L-lactate dehydrogenase [Marinicella gelatinilytica]MCX7545332.1 L-lactate dehydrogenase [Marinicella gelatinilytica]